MKHMTRRQKRQLLTYLLCAVLLFGGIIALYIHHLSRSISSLTLNALEELSQHDMYNINGTLEHTWEHLNSTAQRIRHSQPETFLELADELYEKQDSSPLEGMGLLDADGLLHTADQQTISVKDSEYVRRLENGERKTVLLYKGARIPNLKEPALLYAVKIQHFKVEDATLVAAVAVQKISHISNQLKIDSFDGKGFSTVIDSQGNFIVNLPGLGGISDTSNFFEWFKRGRFTPPLTAQKLIDQIKNGQDVIFAYTNADGIKKVVSSMRVPATDWTLIVNIPEEILSRQSQNFIFMALIMLGANMLLLVCLLIFFYRVKLLSIHEKTQIQTKEEFLSHIRHELRTPLNGIIGLHYLMQNHLNEPKQMEEYIQKSAHAVKYLQMIINDMLDLSQLTQNKLHLDKKPFSLKHTLSTLDSLIRMQTEEKHIRFIVETNIQHPFIIGDDMRLEQALLNILNNAVQFTPNGGTVAFRTRQETLSGGTVTTVFTVEDTGCGMSEAFQQTLFNSPAEKNAAPHSDTRLGLTLSSQLIKKMGGELNVQSQVGKGSLFTISLPAPIPPEKEKDAVLPATLKRKFRPDKKLNILVAEDNELNAEILMEVLSLEGHRVSWAANGRQTVDTFAASAPDEFDLILMDLQMPVMDGYEAARQIRALNRPDAKTVSIWACTANTFQEEQKSVKNYGMNGVILKPIDVKQLLKKLKENA